MYVGRAAVIFVDELSLNLGEASEGEAQMDRRSGSGNFDRSGRRLEQMRIEKSGRR
jgi:hypothetical protein